jgi:hypothetical protein
LASVVVHTRTDSSGTDADADAAAHIGSMISATMDAGRMDASGVYAADAGTARATAPRRCVGGSTRDANEGRGGEASDFSIRHETSFLVWEDVASRTRPASKAGEKGPALPPVLASPMAKDRSDRYANSANGMFCFRSRT